MQRNNQRCASGFPYVDNTKLHTEYLVKFIGLNYTDPKVSGSTVQLRTWSILKLLN